MLKTCYCFGVKSFWDTRLIHDSSQQAWDALNGEKYERDWPAWCQALIGILICASVLWIPIVAILQ